MRTIALTLAVLLACGALAACETREISYINGVPETDLPITQPPVVVVPHNVVVPHMR